MELIDLKAEPRKGRGKSAARHLRNNDAVPAVLYGAKMDSMPISVSTLDLTTMVRVHGSSGLFINLAINGDTVPSRTVMLKEIQMDTFDLKYLHVDFQAINVSEKITISVPVEAVGESVGVKAGGMIQLIRRELDIICKPGDMPEVIQIDTTDLEVGDSVHVEEIDLGADVEIPHDVNFTVLTVVPPTSDVEEEEGDEDLEEDVEETAAEEEEGVEE
ncbi:RplY [Desulforapulum autotrophicum HRM2]|uniref:Large ribosomal subunit protein bL25 n=1 Tax=Desulforapulum autotrophicum (strain ATCC 43914 / DSM 3382 / VKM B-1955 / HRM2) TaxID=177437 RepID=RL25_DESAH|nr:50S ribosomal protein L25 [Desulforapulum autotrophicum]C0QAZ0.1 RecName: Full=Large ribosomal subunit protein bL25; AltName: Full=50S ribosomal protein L25; AltName: Full=General stress protein CTC [Desulforapulum autotrophicum HRM2]ACN14789.1 RplY [Desulforapulum autotrophicum HRM2]